jgi:hypothetical protein
MLTTLINKLSGTELTGLAALCLIGGIGLLFFALATFSSVKLFNVIDLSKDTTK